MNKITHIFFIFFGIVTTSYLSASDKTNNSGLQSKSSTKTIVETYNAHTELVEANRKITALEFELKNQKKSYTTTGTQCNRTYYRNSDDNQKNLGELYLRLRESDMNQIDKAQKESRDAKKNLSVAQQQLATLQQEKIYYKRIAIGGVIVSTGLLAGIVVYKINK